jgi:hypothetical protein
MENPMNLLLLNGPSSPEPNRNPLYRGTDRAHPTYCHSLPERHEINKFFFWFLEEGGELGVVHDLEKAERYAQLLRMHVKGQSFEVIEVVDEGAAPSCGSQFLGFDLSAHYNISLLRWGLKSLPALNQLPEAIHNLCELINRCYGPQLNGSGLFDAHDVATSCLQSMIALQTFFPSLFEGGELKRFNAIGVYRVESGLEPAAGGWHRSEAIRQSRQG